MKKNFLVFLFITLSSLYSQLDKQVILDKESYNPIDINTNAFACHSRSNYAAISHNDDVGIVYRKVYDLSRKKKRVAVHYINFKTQEKSIVWQKDVSQISDMRCYLVYDTACRPHVFVQRGQQYFYFQKSANNWIEEQLQIDFRSALPKNVFLQEHKISHIGIAENNNVVAVFHATLRVPNKEKYRFILAEKRQNKWNYNYLDQFPKDIRRIFYIRVKNNNVYSLVYNRENYLCEAETKNNNWNETIIDKGDSLEEAGWEASCAFDNNGNLFVASTFMRVVSSGSFVFSELRLHSKVKGLWTKEVLSKASSGYHGSDGTRYTGASPSLSIDSNNHCHIIFNDIASWHDNMGRNDFSEGNLRYMNNAEKKWKDLNIYTQLGQSNNKKVLHEFLYPKVVLSKEKIHFFGIERITKNASTRFAYKPSMKFSLIHISQKTKY